MFSRFTLIPSLTSLFLMTQIVPTVCAQGMQNWLNNEVNNIQQDAAAGAINSKQENKLINEDAMIQMQKQQYMNQNGGFLTPQQKQQIGSELHSVNNQLGRTVQKNNSGLFNTNGIMPTTGAMPWQRWNGFQNAPPVTSVNGIPMNAYGQPVNFNGVPMNAYGQPINANGVPVNSNGYPHHHHHHDHPWNQ